jgi:tetratricopeptide (TPR) repeat protein
VLIVLDNARDAEHARLLLPGSAGPVVVVTSRNELTSLVAIEGAQPVDLPLLDSEESRHLIIRHLGIDEVTAEVAAVDELIELCGRLPLALSIVAARAASRPELPLSEIVSQLRGGHGRLDVLSLGEPAGDLRAVFSCSYKQLEPAAARIFRLIGLYPGSDIALSGAASLAGIPPQEARRLLEQLTRAHLLTEQRGQHWEIHDLLRAYASEQAAIQDSESERRDAVRRLLDHCLHTAHAAARLIDPSCDPPSLLPLVDGVTPEQVNDDASAMRWFAAEHRTLMNAIALAASSGHESHAWKLAWSTATWCCRRGLWADLETAQRIALAAAERIDDRIGQGHAHCFLASACTQVDLRDEAETHLQQALELFRQLGDRVGEATVYLGIIRELDHQRQYVTALHHAMRFLELVRAAGRRISEAIGLNEVGWFYARLGNHAQALHWCQQALDLSQELGYRPGQAWTWDSLGYANHHLGRLDKAVDCYRNALDLFQELDDQHQKAGSLDRLGDTHAAAGNLAAANSSWHQAAYTLECMHLTSAAEQIRAKMRPHPGSG